eukprot:s255_g8.t1
MAGGWWILGPLSPAFPCWAKNPPTVLTTIGDATNGSVIGLFLLPLSQCLGQTRHAGHPKMMVGKRDCQIRSSLPRSHWPGKIRLAWLVIFFPELASETLDLEMTHSHEMRIGTLRSPTKPDAFFEAPEDIPAVPESLPWKFSFSSESTACSTMEAAENVIEVSLSKRVSARRGRREQDEQYLQSFLQEFKFQGLNQPRSQGYFNFQAEQFYPIHVAAMLGDYHLLRLLVAQGVDFQQRSSKGRTALDLARERDYCGSHCMAIAFLKSRTPIVPMREFMRMSG